jgi:CRP-like cAMP-binding protein
LHKWLAGRRPRWPEGVMEERNIVEKVIALEAVELLSSLTPDQLSRIALIAKEVKYPPGHLIFRPDQPIEALYVILEGAVEIGRNGETLHTARQNEVLGSWALFDDSPLPFTAKTSEDTVLLRISRDDFYDLLSDNIELATSIFSTLVRRFRKLIDK